MRKMISFFPKKIKDFQRMRKKTDSDKNGVWKKIWLLLCSWTSIKKYSRVNLKESPSKSIKDCRKLWTTGHLVNAEVATKKSSRPTRISRRQGNIS